MANIKSAKKSIKTDAVKTVDNTSRTSKIKNDMKKIEDAVKNNNVELANKELKTFVSDIDTACSKGLVKKNTCAREKSRLNKKVKEMSK
ncbi:MAG TPA: 30S ribosomal protein S20 [Bacilli bacterium]|jgi:small subunit ribosomal protein S20|nr:30S ribosomal protein S20 [Bacilli bacterium]HQC84091.1 30S ribosomal protein S20 [Bacilli bacterium]